jgi:hypothetical protein
MANIPFRLLESFPANTSPLHLLKQHKPEREKGEGAFGSLHILEHDTLISTKQNTMLANLSLVN